MNAAHTPLAAQGPNVPVHDAASQTDSELSALMDGELSADELSGVLQRLADSDVDQQTGRSYQLIGDAMRGSIPAAATQAPHVFMAGVRARIRAESPVSSWEKPADVGLSQLNVRAPAANDAVFRWKLAAGAASLAAVFAVSWNLLGVAPQGAERLASPQLALTQPATPLAEPVNAVAALNTLVVNTAQGPVLRDARLEQLMTEHRQYGGMSALQMPAGFLRDATHQTAPQR